MIKEIQFFTAGCPRSQISGKNLKRALKEMQIDIEIEIIDAPALFKEHGVNSFPGIKINSQLLSEGGFLSIERCKELLSEQKG